MQWPWSQRRSAAPNPPAPVTPPEPPAPAPRTAEPPAPQAPIEAYLSELLTELRAISGGQVATYIPELAKADPNLCAVVIATADGQIYAAGDCNHAFTIQSVSKPFLYGAMLDEFGREAVLKRVGVEPTGAAFNSMALDEANNRPFNPMVNAGAIAVAAMVPGASVAARVEAVRAHFSNLAGRDLAIDTTVFQSERDTGDRNRAIAARMHELGMTSGDPTENLDVYFNECSVLTTTRDIALMGATLANGGVNPLTGKRVLSEDAVRDVVTVMNTCGMYNYAGQWSFEIGLPAKSGVSGSIVAIIPGQAAIAAFSPPIDELGNSVRAIHACRRIAHDFGLHAFRTHALARSVVRRVVHGDVLRSKRVRPAAERAVLDAQGKRIAVIEAQDALFLGSAERLLRELWTQSAASDFIVLDLRRVFGADEAARALLVRSLEALRGAGKHLAFAHVSAQGQLAALYADAHAAGARLFADRDQALEWCEGEVIAAAAPARVAQSFSLHGLDIFRGLTPADVRLIESAAKPMSFEAGQVIFKEGDPAKLFFIISQGSVSIRLNLGGEGATRTVRVAAMGPGMSFGEMALLVGGVRSADVTADERVLCYGFSVEELEELAGAQPGLLRKIYGNMARDLSERLRRASNEIRALEH